MTLDQLEALCENWKAITDPAAQREAFARIIDSTLRVLGVYRRELADEFGVAESTVSRWANGIARPHPNYQRLVLEKIQRRIARLQREQGRGFPSAASM